MGFRFTGDIAGFHILYIPLQIIASPPRRDLYTLTTVIIEADGNERGINKYKRK
jgi:hypothetical protein